MDEVKERLEEEQRQCQVTLKNLWDECESCLESTCMRYYTTCKHGLSTFRRKVGKKFVSGKCSWIHVTVLERTCLIFSIPVSASYYLVTSINLIWRVSKCYMAEITCDYIHWTLNQNEFACTLVWLHGHWLFPWFRQSHTIYMMLSLTVRLALRCSITVKNAT